MGKRKKAKSAGRCIVVLESDKHSGHKLGLMSPKTVILEEDAYGGFTEVTPQLSATQQYLWELRQRNIDKAVELADGTPIYIIDCGDVTHGNGHPDRLVTSRKDDQVVIAAYTWTPWAAVRNVSGIAIAAGTEAHNFGENSAEMALAARLRAMRDWKVEVVRHGRDTFCGAVIDYAHHGPSQSKRKWLEGNTLRYYIRDVMIADILAGYEPPDYVVRGHVHAYIPETVRVDAGGREYRTEAIVMPSLCGPTAYAQKVTQSVPRIQNGTVALEIDNGRVTAHPMIETVDLRSKRQW